MFYFFVLLPKDLAPIGIKVCSLMQVFFYFMVSSSLLAYTNVVGF